jgi:hypothetical protein
MNAPQKLTLYDSPFVSEKFYENIDWKIVIKMLASDKILRIVKIKNKFGESLYHDNERKQILDLLKKGCRFAKTKKEIDNAVETNTLHTILPKLYHCTEKYMTDALEVKYFYDKKKKIGRVYPEYSLSLCNLRRSIRHVLSNGHYLDIDIVNCHFKIADELFNKPKIQFPLLHDYVVRRDFYLNQLCFHFNELPETLGVLGRKPLNIVDDYDMLKECFLIQLYFGTWEGWRNDNHMPPICEPLFITNLKGEFEGIANIIQHQEPEWVEIMKNTKKTQNPNGTIVSWYLQEWERRLLETIKDTLKNIKQIKKNNCVLCFDGIMVELNEKNNDKPAQDKILKTACDAVKLKHNIEIELKIKPFDKLQYVEVLDEIEIEEFDDNMVIIDDKDDKEASSIIYERLLRDTLLYCRGTYFLKTKNQWVCTKKNVDDHLLQVILESNIYTQSASKKELKCYCQSVNNARNVRESILSYVATIPQDNLYNQFHDSTRGKVCFEDGVLFLEEKKFRLWTDDYFKVKENMVYTTVIINRKFKSVFDNRDNEDWKKEKQTIFDELFNKILGEQATRMLQQLSRAIGGYFIDKDWGLWIGDRNCGKGCINELLMTAFENYITNLPSNCLLHSKFANKDTKEHSWLIDLQFKRITLVQEFKKDADKKQNNVIVDGVAIKSICSGGDPQKARKNYQDEMEFVVGTKLFLMCNDVPKIEPEDCLETCIQYNSGKQFKSKEFIDRRNKELVERTKDIKDKDEVYSIMKEMEKYLPADDKMKDKCKSALWGDAFVLLLLDNFVETKLEPSSDSDLKEGSNNEDMLTQWFVFTKNNEDMLNNQQLKKMNEDYPVKMSFQKFKNLLMARGCVEFRTGTGRGLKYIRENKRNVEEETNAVAESKNYQK